MHLRYNYRLYPTSGQQVALAKAFGCARMVYNDGLRARQDAHASGLSFPKASDLSKRLITEAKKTPERAWLSGVSAVVLQQSLRDLDAAYSNFFASIKGARKGPKVGEPRFKSKRDTRQSIRFTTNACWKITPGGKLRLPKIGDVEVKWSRALPSISSSVTVIKDGVGRYFASFVVEVGREPLSKTDTEIGIDLGLSHFAILSDGTKVASPKFLRRAEKKLKRLQQDLSRKQKGSNNRKKQVVKVAKAHARVAGSRRDFHHKLSTTITRENQAVYVEDLAVGGIVRTGMKGLAKSVHDAGWSSFVRMLEYKAVRYGRTFAKVDRWAPTSQVCSACGVKDGKKPLSVREWTCACGAVHDRDVNAAINIKILGQKVAAGRAETENACGAQVRPGLVPAPRSEAGTRPDPHTRVAGILTLKGREEVKRLRSARPVDVVAGIAKGQP